MKPRAEALPVPEGNRYWSVEIESRGAHHFRFPTFAWASALIRCVQAQQAALRISKGEIAATRLAEFSPAAAAVVGVCWWHRAAELEAPVPAVTATQEELLAYGEAVASEWIDADLSLMDLIDAYNVCYAKLAAKLGLVVVAQARADFSEGTAPPSPADGASGGASSNSGPISTGSPLTPGS